MESHNYDYTTLQIVEEESYLGDLNIQIAKRHVPRVKGLRLIRSAFLTALKQAVSKEEVIKSCEESRKKDESMHSDSNGKRRLDMHADGNIRKPEDSWFENVFDHLVADGSGLNYHPPISDMHSSDTSPEPNPMRLYTKPGSVRNKKYNYIPLMSVLIVFLLLQISETSFELWIIKRARRC